MGGKTRFFAIFAALMAAAFRFTSGNTETKQPGHQTAAETAVTKHPRADARLLRTFTDFDKVSGDYAPPLNSNRSCEASANYHAERPRTDWVIATVPDPERSNLKLDFDREVEAIQNAAQASGYQFERFWFPWHLDGAASADQADQEIEGGDKGPRPDEIPGVLLFRRSAPHEGEGHHPLSSLAVILVGETAVSGINPRQFQYAVCLGASLSRKWTDESAIPVIGPGYSASFHSLSVLSGKHALEVRTWTTDSDSQTQFLKAVPGRRIGLRTTVPSSKASINAFRQFIQREWNEQGPIVMLAEEGTAVASGLDSLSNDIGSDAKNKPPSQAKNRVITVQFPRNIAILRNASEAMNGSSKDAKGEMPHTGLTLSLKQEQTSFEIPKFAADQTPVSQEAQLFSIAGLLKTGMIHYAGIVASDPLDELYLIRYLHASCPNLRLFTLNPDILLEHGLDSSSFEGVLAVTNYPLFPINQIWSGARGTLHAFPSRRFEAIYNATIDLLTFINGQTLSATAAPYAEFRNPFEKFDKDHTPDFPLWLTIAGRTAFEPVAILPHDKEVNMGKSVERGHPRLVPVYWGSWGYCFGVLLFTALLYCGALASASPGGDRRLALFAVKPGEPGAGARALYLAAMGAFLSLLTAFWILVPGQIIVENFLASGHSPVPLKLFGCGMFLCGALVSLAMFSLTESRRHGRVTVRDKAGLRDLLLATGPRSTRAAFSCCIVVLPLSFLAMGRLLPPDPSMTVEHMCHMFLIASFVLGALMVASVHPTFDVFAFRAAAGNIRMVEVKLAALKDPANTVTILVSAFSLFTTLIVYLLFVLLKGADTNAFLQACRALNLTSGVSTLVPASLLIVVWVSVAFVHLQRITHYEDRCPRVPSLPEDPFCPRLASSVAETRIRTNRLKFHPAHGVVLAALVVFGFSLLHDHSQQTLENSTTEWFLIWGATLAGFFLLLVWIRLLLVWSAFSEFLQQLERHPLRNVFSLLPRGFVWSPVWQGGGKKRTHVVITRSLECIFALREHPKTPPALRRCINARIDGFQKLAKELLQISASRRRIPRKLFRDIERDLAEIGTVAAGQLERQKWTKGDYELKTELSIREQTKEALRIPGTRYEEEEPTVICGELIAFRLLAFINYVMWQLDNLTGFLSFGFLLLAIALNSYAFRSATLIDWMLVVMFLVLSAGIISVFAQADRDAILSRITGTEEGKLDRHFFLHVASYGAMPLLVLAATHFPVVGKFFFSWVKPALEAIH